MDDDVTEAKAVAGQQPVIALNEDFDETLYLRAFPDVAAAVAAGTLTSGYDHYCRIGRAEARLEHALYRAERLRHFQAYRGGAGETYSIDALLVSPCGARMLIGWVDDRYDPMTRLRIAGDLTDRGMTGFARIRRLDVEDHLKAARPYHFGFWIFQGRSAVRPPPPGAPRTVEMHFASGAVAEYDKPPATVTDEELRNLVLGYIAKAEYSGNWWARHMANLDGGIGRALIGFNRGLTNTITAGAVAQRFGPQARTVHCSVIVVLYGVGHFMFVQAALFSQCQGSEDHEFIYVVNSPELFDTISADARINAMAYGIAQTLVFLPGNAGFGAANNVALRFARSSRILFMNPDVFPRDPDWAARHDTLIAQAPEQQSRLFGTTLYYDDGSLMHGGMYIDRDIGTDIRDGVIVQRPMLRVEHYGKGSPPDSTLHTRPRPVPAVTGAFISADRAWLERLGGFDEDYVFGHYEDADLCLRSLQAGCPAWLHDLRLWHLEGKGSVKAPEHSGAQILNRWLFSLNWEPVVMPDLIGRAPGRDLWGAGSERN